MTTHIWQEYLDLVEQLRRTERGKEIYAMRKETIERVFADAKEKHAMRYTHHRGLARVTSWVRLKYAAMNLKKLAEWSWNNSFFHLIASLFLLFMLKSPLSPNENRDFFDTLKTPRKKLFRAVFSSFDQSPITSGSQSLQKTIQLSSILEST